jgi:hypothetical protein
MAKLKLNLGTLQVESFRSTEATEAERGTVDGQEAPFAATKPSCAVSCGYVTDPCICGPVEPLTPAC